MSDAKTYIIVPLSDAEKLKRITPIGYDYPEAVSTSGPDCSDLKPQPLFTKDGRPLTQMKQTKKQ